MPIPPLRLMSAGCKSDAIRRVAGHSDAIHTPGKPWHNIRIQNGNSSHHNICAFLDCIFANLWLCAMFRLT